MRDPLRRRYERLLWLYPASYRRRWGAELVSTLLDCAEPGQRRPRAVEVWDLVRGALYQRIRTPATWLVSSVILLVVCLVGGMAWLALAADGQFDPIEEHYRGVPACDNLPERTRERLGAVAKTEIRRDHYERDTCRWNRRGLTITVEVFEPLKGRTYGDLPMRGENGESQAMRSPLLRREGAQRQNADRQYIFYGKRENYYNSFQQLYTYSDAKLCGLAFRHDNLVVEVKRVASADCAEIVRGIAEDYVRRNHAGYHHFVLYDCLSDNGDFTPSVPREGCPPDASSSANRFRDD